MLDRIDGDTDAILRQSKLTQELGTNLEGGSRRVTSSVADGMSVSSGSWAHALTDTDRDRQDVNSRLVNRYQEHSDGLHSAQGTYLDGDASATHSASSVSYGIAAQI